MSDGDLVLKNLDVPKVEDAAADILRVLMKHGLTHSQSLMAMASVFHFMQAQIKDQPGLQLEYEKMFCYMTGIIRA